MTRVTIEVDLDDAVFSSLGEAEGYVDEQIGGILEDDDAVLRWNIQKVEEV